MRAWPTLFHCQWMQQSNILVDDSNETLQCKHFEDHQNCNCFTVATVKRYSGMNTVRLCNANITKIITLTTVFPLVHAATRKYWKWIQCTTMAHNVAIKQPVFSITNHAHHQNSADLHLKLARLLTYFPFGISSRALFLQHSLPSFSSVLANYSVFSSIWCWLAAVCLHHWLPLPHTRTWQRIISNNIYSFCFQQTFTDGNDNHDAQNGLNVNSRQRCFGRLAA